MQTHVQPSADLYRGESQHLLVLDVPGVTVDGLSLQVDDKVLTVEATPAPGPESKLIGRGWNPAPFRRTFALGDRVDLDRVTARLEAGVLHIELPHLEAQGPRSIEVHQA